MPIIVFLLACLFLPALHGQDKKSLSVLDGILADAVREDLAPGAVLIVGHEGKIVYRKAVGYRSLKPRRERMTPDTVFDVASLTKVLATTASVMHLFEQGKVRLGDPVAQYIPEFAKNGKESVTVRDLLTHHSGLSAVFPLQPYWTGKQEGYRRANERPLTGPPGAQFRYNDANFIVLGELVERVSGISLDQYSQTHIFRPLKMNHTRFRPPPSWRARIAPTDIDKRTQRMLRGVVHDPIARQMGGVAGNAGVFTTADDVAKFAQALLDRDGKVWSAPTIEKMTTPQQPVNAAAVRGLGWDIDSPYSSTRGELLPVGSFGHTGFSGTSLWIDPLTDTYIVLLTNAVHNTGNVVSLRSRVATAVAAALNLKVSDSDRVRMAQITGYNELRANGRRIAARNGQVLTGIDVLEQRDFDFLKRKDGATTRIGVVTNHSGIDRQGRRTIDVLATVPGVELVAIFSPEHGIFGQVDTTEIGNTKDEATGVTVHSVYGGSPEERRPPADVVQGLDAIVFDIQDAGVRFYTYETTLGYFLEAAAAAGKEIFVLDRPNPIGGAYVQGPVSEAGLENFTNYMPMPVRHGMTMGELARMFNKEREINARLTVVSMQGWQRGDWFDSTGLLWVNPSPNMRSVTQAALYPGVALVEGTNVSVGRGTDTPFEVVGAPWIKPTELAAYLNAREISGVRFVPITFTPESSKYADEQLGGVNIVLTDRTLVDAPELGLELASALLKLYPEQYKSERMIEILAHRASYDALISGEDPRRIADRWAEELDKFMKVRTKYLLY